MSLVANPVILSSSMVNPSFEGLQQLFIKGYFNNKLWRSILDEIIKSIDDTNEGYEIISPFGFEVLNDVRFLSGNLRKFYCYIGIPKSASSKSTYVLSKFEECLFNYLSRQHLNFYEEIVLKIVGDNFCKLRSNNYVCQPYDKLIDIQFRILENTLLDDYADYILCSLNSLSAGSDEAKGFLTNARFRSRTYQLYLMFERIFAPYITKLNLNQLHFLSDIRNKIQNKVSIYYQDEQLHSVANSSDLYILHNLILPRIEEMINKISKGNDLLKLRTLSYHLNEELFLTIDRNIYKSVKEFVIHTYISYCIKDA